MGDIQPYVCIFEWCSKPDELFASTDDWMQHMEEEDAASRWICSICMPSEIFESAEDFENHSQLPILTEMSLRVLPVDFESCPLCRWSEKQSERMQNLQDHIAEHLHSFALRSLP
jgi:hypothetical protein